MAGAASEKNNPRSNRKKSKKTKAKKNIILNIILVIAACVFAFSAYQLYKIQSNYNVAVKEYDDIAKEISIPSIEIAADSIEEDETNPETISEELRQVFTSISELKQINPDTIGWISIPDTEIYYPIVQAADNDYYLTHTFKRESNSSGAIFLDAHITEGLDAKNPIIYGHNMNNGSMFAALKQYQSQSFYDTHQYFTIITENEYRTYQVFSAYITSPEGGSTYTYSFGSDESFLEYIEVAKKASLISADVSINSDAIIVTLSTCTNTGDTRFIVHGVLISRVQNSQ